MGKRAGRGHRIAKMRKTKTHVTRPSKRSRQRRRADIEETDEGERFTYQKTFTLKEDDEVTASG